MAKIIYILPLLLLLGCQSFDNKYVDNLIEEKQRLTDENKDLRESLEQQAKRIAELNQVIEGLKYPAAERSRKIDQLIGENNFDEAYAEIIALNQLFPGSDESKKTDTQKETIKAKIARQNSQEEKLYIQGFKALSDNYKFTIDYLTVSVGKIKIEDRYTFDRNGRKFQYFEAAKENKFITIPVTFTSKVKDPRLPQFAVYSIQGDKLVYEGNFRTHFAKWQSENTYQGKRNDSRNDFSTSSAIPFNLGVEVSTQTATEPLVILVKNENCLGRKTEPTRQPPVYYSGICDYEKELTLDRLYKSYTVVNVLNKAKL